MSNVLSDPCELLNVMVMFARPMEDFLPWCAILKAFSNIVGTLLFGLIQIFFDKNYNIGKGM